jgi:hypothetical protein
MDAISMEEKEKRVKQYFDTIISGYLVHDLQNLLDEKLDTKHPGGCSAPLAMMVFSAMNILGYLTSSKNTGKIQDAETEECIKEFCNDWMAKINHIYKKSTFQEILVNFFRHGLAHQFMSITSSAITRDPHHNKVIKIIKNEKDEKGIILQVKILANDFLEAINLLKKKIESATKNDLPFINQIFDRLNSIREKHRDNVAELFKKIERNLEIEPIEGSFMPSDTSSIDDISGEIQITTTS